MAKHLQRTIIVTVTETWTLVWADQAEQPVGNGAPAPVPPRSPGERPIVQTVAVSLSTVTIQLNSTD